MNKEMSKMKNYVLITGASQGIGEAFAYYFASIKRHLILCARSESKLKLLSETLSQKYSVDVEIICQDLSKLDSAYQLFEACKPFEVETVINNAGVGLFGTFKSHTYTQIQQMITLNITTLSQLALLFLPQLKTYSGTLINVSSVAAFQPIPLMSTYAATKAYVLSFSEGLHYELKEEGVHVLTVCPGPTATGFFDNAQEGFRKYPFSFETPETLIENVKIALRKKEPLLISGWKNKLVPIVERLFCRAFVIKRTHHMMKKRFL